MSTTVLDAGNALLEACKNKKVKLEEVTALLAQDANLEFADTNGATALYYAVYNDRIDIVRELIKRHANVNVQVNSYFPSPLMAAIPGASLEIVTLLLENGANTTIENSDGYHPLIICLHSLTGDEKNDAEILKIARLLLEGTGDKKNKIHPDREISKTTHIIKGTTCLMLATKTTKNRSIDMLKLLLEYKADIYHAASNGDTALSLATEESMKYLKPSSDNNEEQDPIRRPKFK